MPVVLRIDGLKFMFYSNEGIPLEPIHIHVQSGRNEAKFWLRPTVRLAYNRGFDSKTLSRAERMVEDHKKSLEKAWNDYFA